MAIAANTRLDHYEILALLGKGGMGEVYLARDARLSRNVALKLLPAEFTQSAERIRRFEHEAKAASALNHPNILTIYEIGTTDHTHFIATEYIEGETLRDRMARERLSLQAALDIATQIASALAAAHEAGIIHRDIKPENVMLRKDGIVKVLDFGLAKLTEKPTPVTHDSEAPTLLQHTTDAGTVLGTASYMSPEQARGEKVDARSDLFSLGVVLYEMIAGQRPFAGANMLDVVGAVLHQEPKPLPQETEAAPPEVQRIVSQALQKDRTHRYQASQDLLLDLQSLKQELEIEARLKGRNSEVAPTAILPPAATAERAAVRTTSSASIILSELKRHKRGVAITLAAMLVLVSGAGFWLYQLLRQTNTPASNQALKITRLTSTGKATHAAISPDGKYVVYAQDEGGQQSLWVTQVAAASNVQIVPPAAGVIYQGITFARDGNFIYYVRTDKENPDGVLWHSPVLGGQARKVLVNIRSPITLSPDGKQMAFVRNGQGESALMIVNADSGEERKLAVHKLPDLFSPGGPSWSPDGDVIAVGRSVRREGNYRNVVGVRVADGIEQPMTSKRWLGITDLRVAWLSDSSGVLASAAEQPSLAQIMYLAWQSDEARNLTADLNGFVDITLTENSSTMAAVRSERVVNLWISSNGNYRQAQQITSGAGNNDGATGISWTPDGKIVYNSRGNVWITDNEGTNNKQLSAKAFVHRDPTVSPDGRYIVWVSVQGQVDQAHIWRMGIDGSNPKQLTSGLGGVFPQISPDGRWVVYYAIGDLRLWKIPIDGGEPVPVSDKPARIPMISPDGKQIACNYLDEASGQYKIAVIPFEGGAPTKIFDISGDATQPLQWTPDGRAIAFIRTTNGVSNIWAQPLAGGEPKQLTEFKDQRIFNFAWSRDGKQLALSCGVVNSDVVLLSGFR